MALTFFLLCARAQPFVWDSLGNTRSMGRRKKVATAPASSINESLTFITTAPAVPITTAAVSRAIDLAATLETPDITPTATLHPRRSSVPTLPHILQEVSPPGPPDNRCSPAIDRHYSPPPSSRAARQYEILDQVTHYSPPNAPADNPRSPSPTRSTTSYSSEHPSEASTVLYSPSHAPRPLPTSDPDWGYVVSLLRESLLSTSGWKERDKEELTSLFIIWGFIGQLNPSEKAHLFRRLRLYFIVLSHGWSSALVDSKEKRTEPAGILLSDAALRASGTRASARASTRRTTSQTTRKSPRLSSQPRKGKGKGQG